MPASLAISLPVADHAALCGAVRRSDLPNAAVAILERAADSGDGTRGLRLDPAIAWMIATSLTPTLATRSALAALDAAYWSRGTESIHHADAIRSAGLSSSHSGSEAA